MDIGRLKITSHLLLIKGLYIKVDLHLNTNKIMTLKQKKPINALPAKLRFSSAYWSFSKLVSISRQQHIGRNLAFFWGGGGKDT